MTLGLEERENKGFSSPCLTGRKYNLLVSSSSFIFHLKQRNPILAYATLILFFFKVRTIAAHADNALADISRLGTCLPNTMIDS